MQVHKVREQMKQNLQSQYSEEAESRLLKFEEEKCSFCRQSYPLGVKTANGTFVFCCHDCAINVLPELIADSIDFNSAKQDTSVEGCANLLNAIIANFWKAIALRLQGR